MLVPAACQRRLLRQRWPGNNKKLPQKIFCNEADVSLYQRQGSDQLVRNPQEEA
jgi:hypothetical protein